MFGSSTEETRKDERLNTSFYYSGTWGTVINRFVTQAMSNYPLTIYCSGKQIRGMINLTDAIRCVEMYIDNPPKKGEYRRFNQMCEQQYSIKELAEIVVKIAKEYGYDSVVQHIDNPRVEKEDHYYNVKCSKVTDLGLKPHNMIEEVAGMFIDLKPYINGINKDIIMPKVKWK